MNQIALPQEGTETSYRFSTIPTILISITISFLLYKLFFHFSEQIWGYYEQIDPMLLTPSIRQWVSEKDGIEAYVLYLFSFIGMGTAFFVSMVNNKLAYFPRAMVNEFPVSKLRVLLIVLCLICSVQFYHMVGWHPPMAAIASGRQFVIAYLEVIALLLMFRATMQLPTKSSCLIIMAILFPICFIATQQISLIDYAFIFSPAFRMLNHFKLREIYFQYDLLMPMLAAMWMKFGFSLNDFQVIPRMAMFLFLLGMLAYANRVFERPQFIFIVAVIIVRIYALPNDFAASVQISPLRLDLWLILLLITWQKGIYSKWLGISLGLMNVVHHSFGLFYTMSYIQAGVVLFAIDYFNYTTNKNFSFRSLLKKHLILNFSNLMLLSIGLLVYYLLFAHMASEGVIIYKKLGIGFLRVSNISFYWYVLALLCSTFALLVQLRRSLIPRYLEANIFLLFLAVANSLYFLGRSHEWNILNISGSFVLIFFLLIDLLRKKENATISNHNANPKKWLLNMIPVIFIFIVTFYYSERIFTSIKTQANNLFHVRLEYAMGRQTFGESPAKNKFVKTKRELEGKVFNIGQLKTLTHNSPNVYILSYLYDFYYYYYGGYIPRGHFQPYYAWISKQDLVIYLQNLLNHGFYLVIPQAKVLTPNETLAAWEVEGHREILSALNYKYSLEKAGFKLVWN